MNNIGERLKAVRKELSLNQTEFGQRVGLSQTTIGQYENETRPMTDRFISQLESEFGVNKTYLLSGEGDMFVDSSDALVARMRDELGMSGSEIELLQTFLSFPAGEREQVISFGRRFAARFAHDEEPDADEAARLHAQLDAELQAEREAASASSATSSEKKA